MLIAGCALKRPRPPPLAFSLIVPAGMWMCDGQSPNLSKSSLHPKSTNTLGHYFLQIYYIIFYILVCNPPEIDCLYGMT